MHMPTFFTVFYRFLRSSRSRPRPWLPPPRRRCFKSRAHAAELTAGYYNTRERNGYQPIMEMLRQHGAAASFTCVEMRDCEHPLEARCSPEGLLNQVRGCMLPALLHVVLRGQWRGKVGSRAGEWAMHEATANSEAAARSKASRAAARDPCTRPWSQHAPLLLLRSALQVLSTAARVGVPMSGENALQRYDQYAFDKICDSAFGQSVMAGRLEVRAGGADASVQGA